MANATPDYQPLLGGQAVLGDGDNCTASPFVGTAAQADTWLGNAPGTTVYNPSPAVAITGLLTGPDVPTVEAAQAALAAFAGAGDAPLIVPTGISAKGWDAYASCSFPPTALAWDPGGIVQAAPGQAWSGYQIAFKVLISRGAAITSGFWQGTPLPPNWPSWSLN